MKCPFCPSRSLTRLSAMHDIYACTTCGVTFTSGEARDAYHEGGMSVGAMVAIVAGGVGLLVVASWYFQL
jgi:ribosomal protein L37AE/L43A